jgi:3-methylcrotonyl-CoA carboxylase alpha subunit
VTELTTGVDLVEWQLRIAAGEPLPLAQSQIAQGGHAIEVRVCAENPAQDFLPDTGRLLLCDFAQSPGVRVDAGVVTGDEIGIYYDSMIAKLVTHGSTRTEAIARLQSALTQTAIIGPATNLALLQRIAAHPQFMAGLTDTHFIEQHRAVLLHQSEPSPAILSAAALVLEAAVHSNVDASSPWATLNGWRLNAASERAFHLQDRGSGKEYYPRLLRSATDSRLAIGHTIHTLRDVLRRDNEISFVLGGEQHQLSVAKAQDRLSIVIGAQRYELDSVSLEVEFSHADAGGGRLTALMPGRVVKVMVAAGAQVKQGQPLLIMEAMKMEHTITSPRDGVVARVLYAANDTVAADALLVTFEE